LWKDRGLSENHGGTGTFGLAELCAFACGCEGESSPAPKRHVCSQPVHFARHRGVFQEAVAAWLVVASRLFCIRRRIHEYSAQNSDQSRRVVAGRSRTAAAVLKTPPAR